MESSSLIDSGLPLALFVIMTDIGLTLRPRDFHEIVAYPRATGFGTVAAMPVPSAVRGVLMFGFGTVLITVLIGIGRRRLPPLPVQA